jgi:hypothetical protein
MCVCVCVCVCVCLWIEREVGKGDSIFMILIYENRILNSLLMSGENNPPVLCYEMNMSGRLQ